MMKSRMHCKYIEGAVHVQVEGNVGLVIDNIYFRTEVYIIYGLVTVWTAPLAL